jgi:L-lactate dehydrogenase complex protein LldG
MEDSTSREKILKRVRDALIEKTEVPYPILDLDSSVFREIDDAPEVVFAEELIRVGGKFVYCDNEDEFVGALKSFILEKNWGLISSQDMVIREIMQKGGIPVASLEMPITDAQIGLTRCEFLIATSGSVMVSSKLNPGRRITGIPEVHLVLAYSSQLVHDLKQALSGLKKRYKDNFPSMVSVITGPCRTTDIENPMIMGAHGPKELYVFMVDDATE